MNPGRHVGGQNQDGGEVDGTSSEPSYISFTVGLES